MQNTIKLDKQSIPELKYHMEPEHLSAIADLIRTEGRPERGIQTKHT